MIRRATLVVLVVSLMGATAWAEVVPSIRTRYSPASGETFSLQITAGLESWQAQVPVEYAAWIVVSQPQGLVTGSRTVVVTVSPNPAATTRSGAIDIAGTQIFVIQARQPGPGALDPLLAQQWHLDGPQVEPAGANVKAAWTITRGRGAVVSITDDGLQHEHPDLADGYLSAASYDVLDNDPDPSPPLGNGQCEGEVAGGTASCHGTAVAGVAAARLGNGAGGSGVAPEASLVGVRLLGGPTDDAQLEAAFNQALAISDVSNNSWGFADAFVPAGPAAQLAMLADGPNASRRGKIFVWAAGNSHGFGQSCSSDVFVQSLGVIGVGAVEDTGQPAYYSEGCPALFVSAPSSNGSLGNRQITTTDLVGANGADPSDYRSTFGGTSSAAPLVSGVVALMRAANPSLTLRDVKHILARTARRVNLADPDWSRNALRHHERYGFGIVDAKAAVDLATTWTGVTAEMQLAPVMHTVNRVVPDENPVGVEDTIGITAPPGLLIEEVQVDIEMTHSYRSDLELSLTSPSGVVSTFMRPYGEPGADLHWTFRSVRHWGESASGPWLLRVRDLVALDAGVLQSWTLHITGYRPDADTDGDGVPDQFERNVGMNPAVAEVGDLDGDGVSNAAEFAAGTHPRGFFTRYFAEGATSAFFDARFSFLNPGPTTAAVLVRFLRQAGLAPVVQMLRIQPMHRATLDVKAIPDLAVAEFSTVIESDVPIVVDRTMRWDGSGYGGHSEAAIVAPARTWYLAEGSTASGFALFYLVQNPDPATASSIRIRYLLPSGAPIVKTYTIAARSRETIWVNTIPELASTDVSGVVEVTSGPAVIVERAMYLSGGGQLFRAGHESAGVTAPALAWFLAEGATGPYFDTFVLIANPNGTPAAVRATFLLQDGRTYTATYTVAPNSRFNIWLDEESLPGLGKVLANVAVSTTIESTNGVGVIAERAMWWPGPTPATWHEAHDSVGATSTGVKWAVADAEVGGAASTETYLLIANTSNGPASIRVTLLYEDGSSDSQIYTVLAHQRFNVPTGAFFPGAADRRFGAIVESLGATPAPIVVERAMYWNAGGVVWAGGTNAQATKLQ